MVKNTEQNGVTAGVLIMSAGIIGMVTPSMLSWDMMKVGYGTIVLSFFFFTLGLITYLIYNSRRKKFDLIMNGKDLLAHWVYDNGDYVKKIERTYKEAVQQNKSIYTIIITFFAILVPLFAIFGFSSTADDERNLFLLLMGFIITIISLAAFISAPLQRRAALKSLPEAIISTHGLIYLGKLHTWGSPLFFLAGVDLGKRNKEVIFAIKYFTRVGWYKYETYQVAVEIPQGKIDEAKSIVKELQPYVGLQ